MNKFITTIGGLWFNFIFITDDTDIIDTDINDTEYKRYWH